MPHLTTAMLVIVAIIHLLPLTGMHSSQRLTALYGIDCSEANVQILLRHRAVLFGLLGGFLLYAAFCPALQLLGLIAGLVSVLSFIGLAWQVGNYNAQLKRVFIADLLALGCLLLGLLNYGFTVNQA